MSQVFASLVGVGVCCFVPLVAFYAGVHYAKFGLPIAVSWRGIRPTEEDED